MKKLFTILAFMLTFAFVSNAQCNAYYTYAVDSNGFGVQFTDYSNADTSAYITSWFWDFGDGTTSTLQNPFIQQVNPAGQIVCLTIVTSDSCSSTYCDSVRIMQPNPCANFYAYTSVTHETSAGNDGAVDLTVYGGTAPYSYSWNNGATSEDISGLTFGTYTVAVNDAAGCSLTETAYVYQDSTNVPPTYIDSLYSQIDTCLGVGVLIDSVAVTNVNMIDSNNVEITYTIYAGSNYAIVTEAYGINGSGWYWTILNVSCNGTKVGQEFEQAVYISSITGVKENKVTDIKLYPNPVKDNMFIDFTSEESANAQIAVTNMMGQNVYLGSVSVNNGSNKVIVPTSELKNGVYFINIYTNNGSLITSKFVK